MIQIMTKNLNTPIWQLTVGEFLELQARHETAEFPQAKGSELPDRYVYGLAGLAALFGCSKRSAMNLKASGKIDKAIIQDGRKIVVDAALALELVKKKQMI